MTLKLLPLAAAIASVLVGGASAEARDLWQPSPYEQQMERPQAAQESQGATTDAPTSAATQDQLATTNSAHPVDARLNELMNMAGGEGDVTAVGDVQNARPKAVFEAAQTYAAQTAYCERAAEIHRWADSQASTLDRVFNFPHLLLDGGRVLPPVIEQADASYRQKGDDVAITAQTTWNILSPARIVSTAPNWRSYLYVSCSSPLKPNPVLLPGSLAKTHASDEAAWKKGIADGWKLGREQALASFVYGMNSMTRDYIGMLRFYWLNRHGVVSTPILAQGNVGVRVEGRTLNIGETVFRLTGNADWTAPGRWSPEIRNGRPIINDSTYQQMQ